MFYLADAAGQYCKTKIDAQGKEPVRIEQGQVWSGTFTTDNVCWNSGIWIEAGGQYLITVTQGDDWHDGNIAASINGYRLSEIPNIYSRIAGSFATLLRRNLFRPFFAVVARIGSIGAEELFLDPDPDRSGKIMEVIRPRRDGELFLYVNDAVLGVPGLAGIFYRNNRGTVMVNVLRR
jgi:hypothetical protein